MPLKKHIELTERELGQLMVLFTSGEVPEMPGFNMTVEEQVDLGERCRKAVWELYWHRRQNGMPTQIDKTGVLNPKEG